MNNQLAALVKRYMLVSIIVLVGLIMIIVGIRTNQDGLFIMAAINLFVGGILALLFSSGILNQKVVFGIGIICIGLTLYLGIETTESVAATQQHDLDYERSTRLYQYTLTQIRDIQRAYKAKNGVYASTFDELKDFFENDKIQKIESMGSVPSRRLTIQERDALYSDNRALDRNMTEREAALLVAMGNPTNSSDLTNFRRDTVQIYFKDEFLSSETRKSARKSLGLGEFDIEELRYIPMTDPKEEWTIETRDSVPYLQGDTIATIHVYGREAIPRFEGGARKIVGFGNLQTNSDKGTWE